MSMTRIPNETPEQRAERLATQRANAAFWEGVLRQLPMVPSYPEARPQPVPEAP
jgi:hypothetical protein